MAYINGNEILFSARINGEGGDNDTPTLRLQEKSTTITENYTTTVTADDGYDGLLKVTITTNVDGTGGTPPEISTEAEMTALLDTAPIGSIYKYTGESGTYENGAYYVVESE